MHEYAPLTITLVAIFAGILVNKADLKELKADILERFASLEKRLDAVDARFDRLEAKLAACKPFYRRFTRVLDNTTKP